MKKWKKSAQGRKGLKFPTLHTVWEGCLAFYDEMNEITSWIY